MIGGSRLVSVNETSRVVFVVGLIWNRAQLAQARYAQVSPRQPIGEEGERGRQDIYHSLVRLLFSSHYCVNA
jgi:hypothetical protein